MLCKGKTKKTTCFIMLLVGIISLAYGLIGIQGVPDAAHAQAQLMGMFSGAGAGLISVAIFLLIRSRILSPEKLKQKEIESSDERSIAVRRAAMSVSWFVALLLFGLLCFVFVAMDMLVASYFALAAMYVQFFAYLVAQKVYEKKM